MSSILMRPAIAELLTPSELRTLLSATGFDAGARHAVERGEIIAIETSSSIETELAGAGAMLLASPPKNLARWLRDGLIVRADRMLTAWAEIPADGGGDAWNRTLFGRADKSEIERLFAAEPGDVFNLSLVELDLLRDRLAGRASQDPDAADAVSRAYREILVGRYRSYRARGAAGLAPYARENGSSLPAEDLRRIDMASQVPPVLRPFARALDSFAGVAPSGTESRFFWKKTIVDDRSIFVLSHVLVEERADSVLFSLREYYPGHSYNILQQIGIVVAVDEDSVIVVANSTVTDRVRGPLGALARMIGRRQARDALKDYLERMRELVEQPDARGTETARHQP